MLVEFIGAAGAGKSFLSDKVFDELRARRTAVRNFDLVEIKKTSPKNLLLASRAAYLAVMTRQKTLSRFVQTFELVARFAIRREICEQVGGVQITSEGLFHRIITMHRNSRGLGMVQLADILYGSIQPPDVVVVVEVNAETAYARRVKRNRANDLYSRASVRADVEIIKECINVIAHIKRTMNPLMRVIRVNSDEEGGKGAIAKIVAALELNDQAHSGTVR